MTFRSRHARAATAGASGRPAGPAGPRRGAIDRDPAAQAAKRLASPRVATIDLNRLLCDTRRCYPIIGGALVYKDTTHLLEPFMRSLTPSV